MEDVNILWLMHIVPYPHFYFRKNMDNTIDY